MPLSALLKALGATLWSLAALGLLVILIWAGRIIDTRLRSPVGVPDEAPRERGALPILKPAPLDSPPLPTTSSARNESVRGNALPLAAPRVPASPAPVVTDAATLQSLFRDAVAHSDSASIIKYGTRPEIAAAARPPDLAVVAIAFYVLGDCLSANAWIAKAIEAYQNQGGKISPALERARDRCAGKHPENKAQNAVGTAESGDHDVRNGELYYGFEDYPRAVTALRRGLNKGAVRHADEAYVYLGLAELALKHYAESCSAFDQLEQLPNLSPRIRKLWTTFADTHCMVVESEL